MPADKAETLRKQRKAAGDKPRKHEKAEMVAFPWQGTLLHADTWRNSRTMQTFADSDATAPLRGCHH